MSLGTATHRLEHGCMPAESAALHVCNQIHQTSLTKLPSNRLRSNNTMWLVATSLIYSYDVRDVWVQRCTESWKQTASYYKFKQSSRIVRLSASIVCVTVNFERRVAKGNDALARPNALWPFYAATHFKDGEMSVGRCLCHSVVSISSNWTFWHIHRSNLRPSISLSLDLYRQSSLYNSNHAASVVEVSLCNYKRLLKGKSWRAWNVVPRCDARKSQNSSRRLWRCLQPYNRSSSTALTTL